MTGEKRDPGQTRRSEDGTKLGADTWPDATHALPDETAVPETPALPEEARLKLRQDRQKSASLRHWRRDDETRPKSAVIDCGWGRILIGASFDDPKALVQTLRAEKPGTRDIAFYLSDPHVLLSYAPHDLFLDPSHSYRLWLSHYRPTNRRPAGFTVRRLQTADDAQAVCDIYAARHMTPIAPNFLMDNRANPVFTYFVAEDPETGQIVATVTGIDHVAAYSDPDNGCSLWCLAVHPQARQPGIGEAMTRAVAEHYLAKGRAFLDLSVMHFNEQAIALYDKLGFERLPVFAVKTKNPINEDLFAGPPLEARLNPYAMLIIDEARRRGIAFEVIDEPSAIFRLTWGGRSILCRESLTQLTSAVAMSICDDKAVTRRLLKEGGLRVPDQVVAGEEADDQAFLDRYGSIVVKPARGEQGRGISVDVRTPEELATALATARQHAETVLLEEFVRGEDLRIIVIGGRVVAGAVRKPAEIVGTGRHSVRDLIETASRRREAATGGESKIPIDAETERVLRSQDLTLDSVPDPDRRIPVRKTANLHTGGTIHDVTDRLHPRLVDAAVRGAKIIDIPVVGFDFLVPAVDEPDYAIIEANERPGLANHEPQPTAERFIDLLFPQTVQSERRQRG